MPEVTIVVDLNNDVMLSEEDHMMYIKRRKNETISEDVLDLCTIFKKTNLSLNFVEVEQLFAMSVDTDYLDVRKLIIHTESGTRFMGTIIDQDMDISENNIFLRVSHMAESPGKTYLKLKFMEL